MQTTIFLNLTKCFFLSSVSQRKNKLNKVLNKWIRRFCLTNLQFMVSLRITAHWNLTSLSFSPWHDNMLVSCFLLFFVSVFGWGKAPLSHFNFLIRLRPAGSSQSPKQRLTQRATHSLILVWLRAEECKCVSVGERGREQEIMKNSEWEHQQKFFHSWMSRLYTKSVNICSLSLSFTRKLL